MGKQVSDAVAGWGCAAVAVLGVAVTGEVDVPQRTVPPLFLREVSPLGRRSVAVQHEDALLDG